MQQILQRFSLIIILFSFIIHNGMSQDPPYLQHINHPWVDSVLSSLSVEEKIAQSIWMATWSDKDISHYVETNNIITQNGIGGLIFFQGSAEKQTELIKHYQSISKVPLAIAMDCEWGAGMRLDGIEDYPFQMTLGAITNDSLIFEMGEKIAQQFRLLGMQVNLAPVADINNNPQNPVINFRSFGENKEKVAVKTGMYTSGMQKHKILATAKHFPGHGDTDTDSHHNLPVIKHDRSRFESVELFPFKHLIKTGIGAVMSAHLSIPSLDSTINLPSTLSYPIITGLLKEELEFKGLVITDAMNMKGVTKYYEPGVADAMAYKAGNDILEYVDNAGNAIKQIKLLLDAGELNIQDIDSRTRKILAFKYWTGLHSSLSTNAEKAEAYFNGAENKAFIRELYKNAITVLNNANNCIPLKSLDKKKIACLALNKTESTAFQKMVANYTKTDNYFWYPGISDQDSLLSALEDYDIVITGIFNTDQRPYRNFGITHEMNEFLELLSRNSKLISVYFGNPYAIDKIDALKVSAGLILTYQENIYTEELSAQLIFGGTGGHGKLPVTINNDYPAGYGILTPGKIRLQYAYPESAGMSSDILNAKIDSIALSGLQAGAYPGCEVIAARRGMVVFHKTYGFHSYDSRINVDKDDLFDLASVTKVSGPLSGLMVLEGMGKFSSSDKLLDYWPESKGSDKAELKMKDILAHQAGLYPWIPYWKNTVKKNGKFKFHTIRNDPSDKYPYTVSNGLYLHKNYRKKIYREIKKSPLGNKEYVYSGLSFFLFPGIIENLSGLAYEDFLNKNIYHKLGAWNIVFNPYRFYPQSRIVPTELDTLFRNQQLHAYVHDEGAAMMGGYSGNAGLFATANDLLKLFEMYRRMGNYGGEQIIPQDVLKNYSSCQFPENENRRGLGFDKPLIDENDGMEEDYPCPGASASSFGHSGYTGTYAWVDPEHEITYVFLSNRVYPTRNNSLISDMNIRTTILQSLYDSIIE